MALAVARKPPGSMNTVALVSAAVGTVTVPVRDVAPDGRGVCDVCQ